MIKSIHIHIPGDSSAGISDEWFTFAETDGCELIPDELEAPDSLLEVKENFRKKLKEALSEIFIDEVHVYFDEEPEIKGI